MAKKGKARRKSGLMQASFRYEGRRYYYYGHTQEELKENELKKREEAKTGIKDEKQRALRTNPSVREYYALWDERRVNGGNVTEATLRGQRTMFRAVAKVVTRSKCEFGDMKLKAIDVDDLLYIQKKLSEKRKARGVRDVMLHLKHVFACAVDDKIITENPFKHKQWEIIKTNNEEKAVNTYHRALSREEQEKFFGADITKNSYYYNVFRLAMLTGMRIGEIGALKYSDIKDGYICIERTVTRTVDGGYKVGDGAKTEAGRRKIAINDDIDAVLKNQKQLNSMLDCGIRSTDDLLFKGKRRGLLKPFPVDREIGIICSKLDIEHFTIHALRDTFCTRCIEAGMQPKTLQTIMGHTDIKMTMNLYGHCMDDTVKEAMESLKIAI